MHIVSVSSAFSDPEQACDELSQKIARARPAGDSPDFIAFFGHPKLIRKEMKDCLQSAFPNSLLHASSSAKGVISSDWDCATDPPACAAFAIFDPNGDYGTASADLSGNVADIAAGTMRSALANAGREGEAPDLVFLSCAPGQEEAVLKGLRRVVGRGTQIFGATSADDDFSGQSAQFSSVGFHNDGIVISVLFPTSKVATSFECGFEATTSNGKVTKAEDRILRTIDGEPAATVYARWQEISLPVSQDGTFVETKINPSRSGPLGKVVGYEAGVPQLQLIQPCKIFPDGSLSLMAEVTEGDRLWCMSGGHSQLMSRVPPLIDLATAGEDDPLHGGLVVLCASESLCSETATRDLALRLKSCLGDLPSLTVFSCGEQWMRDNGDYAHANQMMLCAMFR